MQEMDIRDQLALIQEDPLSRNGSPVLYSALENPMDQGGGLVRGVAKNQTRTNPGSGG